MFQRTYLKLLLGAVLLVLVVLVIWIFSLFSNSGTHRIFLLHGEFYYSGKIVRAPFKEVKQISLSLEENQRSGEDKQNDKEQPTLSSETSEQGEKTQPTSSPEASKQGDKTQPTSSSEAAKQGDKKQAASPSRGTNKKLATPTPPVRTKQIVKNRPTLPPKGSKQPPTPAVNYTVMSDHDLLKAAKAHDQAFYGKYLQTLPASVIERLVRLFGVGNLTTRYSQEQFLKCTGIYALRWLKDAPPEIPVTVPSSSQHCKRMSFQSSGPKVALVSFPGSGNSWVRQLIESATGIYTGAMYCDPSYVKAGMIGEGMDSNHVIATKLHFWPSVVKGYLQGGKAVYIIRSPFAAILSENNRNIARNTKDFNKELASHVTEVDFKYGTYIIMISLMCMMI